jgi:hypothetical protein
MHTWWQQRHRRQQDVQQDYNCHVVRQRSLKEQEPMSLAILEQKGYKGCVAT